MKAVLPEKPIQPTSSSIQRLWIMLKALSCLAWHLFVTMSWKCDTARSFTNTLLPHCIPTSGMRAFLLTKQTNKHYPGLIAPMHMDVHVTTNNSTLRSQMYWKLSSLRLSPWERMTFDGSLLRMETRYSLHSVAYASFWQVVTILAYLALMRTCQLER